MKVQLSKAKALTTIQNFNGTLFRAEFVKKDGSIRKMTCRTGVKKGVKGGGYSHTADPRTSNITVYEFPQGQFRAINIDRLLTIKHGDTEYEVV